MQRNNTPSHTQTDFDHNLIKLKEMLRKYKNKFLKATLDEGKPLLSMHFSRDMSDNDFNLLMIKFDIRGIGLISRIDNQIHLSTNKPDQKQNIYVLFNQLKEIEEILNKEPQANDEKIKEENNKDDFDSLSVDYYDDIVFEFLSIHPTIQNDITSEFEYCKKLMLAARNNDSDILSIIEEGNLKPYKKLYYSAALLESSSFGHPNVCKLLIDHGANINHQALNGFTALMFATSKGHTDTVKMLAEKGANLKIKDKIPGYGLTALEIAEYFKQSEIIAILTKAQKNTNLTTNWFKQVTLSKTNEEKPTISKDSQKFNRSVSF